MSPIRKEICKKFATDSRTKKYIPFIKRIPAEDKIESNNKSIHTEGCLFV